MHNDRASADHPTALQDPHSQFAPLALTMGDPAGIGLEITLSAWRMRKTQNVPHFAFFANPDYIHAHLKRSAHSIPFEVIDDVSSASTLFDDALPVVPIELEVTPTPGKPNKENAPATIAAIDAAVTATLEGRAAAVVTNPIAKNILKEAGFVFPGHTEYLAHLANQARGNSLQSFKPVMMLTSEELRVVPLTIHIPLHSVMAHITPDAIYTTAHIVHNALKTDFGIDRPRIAVAGLNPHAGESGTIGKEEEEIIAPSIRKLKQEGLSITGPHPADTLFHEDARNRYDAAIAMYHDQALIPIKTLAFDRGVNVTLGLPFVRTSPDHGTAFDIAEKGSAKPDSLIEALKVAEFMRKQRRSVQNHGQTPARQAGAQIL